MGISFKLILNTINKGLKVSKVFLEEIFEFGSRDWNDVFVVSLMLGLSKIDDAMEKYGGKGI